MSMEMPLDGERPPLLKAVLRYHWPAVAVTVVACAAIGTVLGLAKGRHYRSTATVLIAPLEGIPYSPESVARQSQANTDAVTDARLAATPAVARLVEGLLRLPPNSLAWRSKLSVAVVPNTQVVKIDYLSSSPRKARQSAHAFSTAYLRYRAIRSQASVSGQLNSLETRARTVQRRLTEATRALASSHTSVHRATLNQQVVIYTDQLAALSVQTAQLAGASRDPGQVLTPASSPVATGVPTAALSLVGAIAGLLLGLALAFLRESRDGRLRVASEVENAGLALLATLTVPPSGPPDAEEIDRYRALRTAVLTHAPAPRVIAVAALSPTILSADVAAGLGTALARAGSEATVVLTSPESDPRGVRDGLAEVLLGDADAHEVRDEVAPRLYLLSPGRRIEAAAEMFASEKLRTTLHDLAGTSGYVLVAGSDTGTTASSALAAVCDEVVLVSQLEDSSVQDLMTAVGEVQRVRGRVLGAVAVQHTRRGDPRLGKASSSLPRIARAWVTQWRASVPKRTTRNAEPSAEQRLRALSTVATALEQRIAAARSGDALAVGEPTASQAGSSDAVAAGEPTAAQAGSGDAFAAGESTAEETPVSSAERPAGTTKSASPTPPADAVDTPGAAAPAPARARKRAAATKRSSGRRSKQS
jgi:capsular polysaccharide biosynthesis protein